MQGITKENIHYWTNTQGALLVSNENTKELKQFSTTDDAINWLFFKGFKDSARQLNKDKNK